MDGIWAMSAAIAAALGGTAAAVGPTPTVIVDRAPATAWRAVDPARLLVVELDDGGRVAIELAVEFAPVHVANIVRLARAGWYDDAAIYRVQDNYVVQWGDGTEKKPLPPGIVARPPAEYERAAAGLDIRALGHRDSFATGTGHAGGWAVAQEAGRAWLPHCYGMVGIARDNAPDTGTGAELYAVIGHAPRQLDRNITIAGRVLDGMEALSARPRGTGPLGFHADPAQWIPIRRVRIAVDLPPAERPRLEVMRTDAPSFTAWLRARANRHDAFYIRPAGALDICNALPPVRPAR